MLNYDTRLCEAFVERFDDKVNIKPIARAADISWADVDPDGSARNAWSDVIRQARVEGKVPQLIEAVLRFRHDNPLDGVLRELLEEFPSNSQPVKERIIGKRNWAEKKLYYEVDRDEHLGMAREAVNTAKGLPVITVWCGELLARHDLVHSRIQEHQFTINGKRLSRSEIRCKLNDDVATDLRRACLAFLENATKEYSDDLQILLTSKSYSGHLLTLAIDVVWERQTCQRLKALLGWCQQIGPVAEDRRLLITVAIQVPERQKSFLSFWTSGQKSMVEDVQKELKSLMGKNPYARLLPPLPPVTFPDLTIWRDRMVVLHDLDQELFDDPQLAQIVPLTEAKPMHNVVIELKKVLCSTST